MIEPLCRLCLEAGRVTPASVCDHLVPHKGDFTAFRLGALRSLCADCHNRLDANNAPRAPVRDDARLPTRTIRGTGQAKGVYSLTRRTQRPLFRAITIGCPKNN